MRAGSPRRLAFAAAVLAAGTALAGGAGCDTLDGAQRVVDRADLASDLAGRLDQAQRLTYTAEYQLAGGAPATVAADQEPARMAFTYPGGTLLVTAESYTDCQPRRGSVTCTVTSAGSPDSGPPTALLARLVEHGMITPAVVSGLLSATALDSDASVEQRDTTIAGQHATCLDVASVDNAAASTFGVCVTTDGVLGSFTGVVDGTRVEQALTQYTGTVAADAFTLPAGATVLDRRGAHS